VVEKPLANTLAEVELMTAAAAAARSRGVQSMIGFNYRRVPALALARELIAEGRLGTVRHIRAAYLQDWLADAEAPMTWRLRRETAGSGALGDIAFHAIDQIQHLTGQKVLEASGEASGMLKTFVTQRPGPGALPELL
jgi:predicted dehydrogenase